MSATDELRRLLDERGVEWESGLPTETIVREPNDALYVERPDGRMHIYYRSYLTPEQAVAATLGRGTCTLINAADDLGDGTSSCMCFKCGYTALDDWWNDFNFCPNCGRKVVDE